MGVEPTLARLRSGVPSPIRRYRRKRVGATGLEPAFPRLKGVVPSPILADTPMSGLWRNRTSRKEHRVTACRMPPLVPDNPYKRSVGDSNPCSADRQSAVLGQTKRTDHRLILRLAILLLTTLCMNFDILPCRREVLPSSLRSYRKFPRLTALLLSMRMTKATAIHTRLCRLVAGTGVEPVPNIRL